MGSLLLVYCNGIWSKSKAQNAEMKYDFKNPANKNDSDNAENCKMQEFGAKNKRIDRVAAVFVHNAMKLRRMKLAFWCLFFAKNYCKSNLFLLK